MKMFYDWIDNSLNENVLFAKFLRNMWTSSENKTYITTLFNVSSLDFRITSIVTVICSILVFRSIKQWITKYRLRYLFRITCFIFMCHTLVLLFCITGEVFNVQIFSTLLPKLQGSESSFAFSRKSLWILSAASFITMGIIRYHWALPVNIIMKSSSLGFNHLQKTANSRRQTIRDLSAEMLRHRDPGDVNPVYVNGWIPLIDSRSVVKGTAETVIAVVPDTANVKVWNSCERNGYIFVWHHAENEPPSWEWPSVPEIESGIWLYRGRSEVRVRCHVQDVQENGADIAHLTQVHSPFIFVGPKNPLAEWIRHYWEAQWSPDEKQFHIARVKLVHRIKFCGYELPYLRFDFDIQQIGPISAFLYGDSKFGKGILLMYITTEEPLLQKVVTEFYSEPVFKPFPALCVIYSEAKMVERDIAVWNSKKYLRNPLLVKEDKSILRYRRWYSQFYSEHSPTLKDVRQRTLEW